MRRSPYAGHYAFSFGPGPVSPAVKWLIWANVGVFLAQQFLPIVALLGLVPALVFGSFFVWQPATYMFLHGGLFHILFNMLALWMFGVELERLWGTRFFLKYYFVTGVGAALTTLLLSVAPFGFGRELYGSITIGASGAVYGLLLAFALYYPDRPLYMYFLFPIPAKYFVMIIGGIAFIASINQSFGGVAHAAHLGGLVFGYVYLKRGRGGLVAGIKYRWVKWRMNRLRRKFDVYSGGRGNDWDRRLH